MNLNRRGPQHAVTGGSQAAAHIYENWRERFVRPMLYATLGFGLVALIVGIATNQGIIQNSVFIGAYLLVLLITFIPAPYWMRISAFLLAAYGLGLNELLTTGILGDCSYFFLVFIVFATLMFSARAGVITLVLTLLTYTVVGVFVQSGTFALLNSHAMVAGVADWLSTITTTILFAVLFILGVRQLQTEYVAAQQSSAETLSTLEKERASLEGRVEARTLQLTAVNEVGRVASSILDPQDLAGRVANLITDQFGYYYAALFLVDETGQDARLYSATGEAGRVLKENKHHLRVGGKSMVGMAISTAKARVALDVGAEPVRFENPLLPYTRSEIALPLIIGDRVLGALDVQSTKAGAFGPQEIDTLQSMASHVAIALENARLFENAQKSVEELETIERQYVLDAWQPIASSEALEYRLGDPDPFVTGSQLEVPLALREQVIGQINLAGDTEWTPEQRNLIETVATQAALALENARLVEESQAAARREHQLAEITGKIWTATNIEGILETALRELGAALDLNEATIQLKMDADHE